MKQDKNKGVSGRNNGKFTEVKDRVHHSFKLCMKVTKIDRNQSIY